MKKSLGALVMVLVPAAVLAAGPADGDWPNYGRTAGGDRHSPLKQINRGNVARLTLAWEFKTGEAGIETGNPTALETTPLAVDGLLFVSTPLGKVLALDPVTGAPRWSRDLPVDRKRHFGDWVTRGVSYWRDGQKKGPCSRRVIVATVDARLAALDAERGSLCADFGQGGILDLVAGVRNKQSYGDEYGQTSPPAIVGDLIVVGSAVADNNSTVGSSGEVRAFDVRSGALRWTWNPVPQDPADPAYSTWKGGSGTPYRRRQHLVHHRRGSETGSRVPADHQPRGRLLRRHAAW
jgi:quinoprotein glucose dehydrogenase